MLSLVSVNIEGRMHLDRVMPFVKAQQLDVLCIQELCEPDLEAFGQVIGGTGFFMPMMRLPEGVRATGGQGPVTLGVGIVSRFPITSHRIHYYHRASETTPEFDNATVESKHATQNLGVLVADIEKEGVQYRIATTHFTWTPRSGEPDDFQRADAKKLLELISPEGEFAFCGDFNAPRGGEIDALFTEHWREQIPVEYTTSIDVSLHRNGQKNPDDFDNLMVDHFFTTPSYAAHDVRLTFGVSDHAAIVGKLEKLA